MKSPKFRLLALAAVSAIALAGCSASGDTASTEEAASTETAAASVVTIEDNAGTHEIQTPVQSVVALDNRTFETLNSWGVELSAGAVSLMPDTNPYVNDESIVDIGNHREPNLELIVAAQPK